MPEENKDFQNTLYTGDNLYILNGLNSEIADLIYLDPPFNSKRVYSAPVGSKAAGTSFKDIWTWQDVDEQYLESLSDEYPDLVEYIKIIGLIHSKAMMSYITYMAQRVIQMHRILKSTGSLYYHCDPTAGHFVKLMLDSIFGKDNFRNEIIWSYSKLTAPTNRQLQRNHDLIYFYSKNQKTAYFEVPKEITKCLTHRYKIGYHIGLRDEKTGKNILNVYGKPTEKAQKLIDSDKYVVRFVKAEGTPIGDVFNIQSINAMAKERTGYPTQKPLELLDRIIQASCPEGGIVLDPFCGCATTCVSAQRLHRRWIGIDIEDKAVDILQDRLEQMGYNDIDEQGLKLKRAERGKDFISINTIKNPKLTPHRTDVVEKDISQPQTKKEIKELLYKQQNCCCNACGTEFRIVDLEIDHIIPKAKGGGDYLENFQLLCGKCNRMKGDRTMEYLRMKLKKRAEKRGEILFGE